MAIIRVDPALLNNFASTMQGIGGGVSSVGSSAASAAEGAPSYEGQFGPLVWPIGAEASSRTSNIATQLVNLGMRLNLKAVEFERADNTTINGLISTSIAWPTITEFLARWSKMTGIPVAALERYLKLGMLSGSSSLYGLLIGMVMGNSLFSWTGRTFMGLKAPAWLNVQRLWHNSIFSDSASKVANNISGSRDLSFFGKEQKLWPERRGRPRDNNPNTELNVALWRDQAWNKEFSRGETELGGVRIAERGDIDLLEAEAGFGVGVGKGKVDLGAYGKVTGASVEQSGVIGSKDLGIGAGVKATAGEAEAFIGIHNGEIGAKVGGKLISGEATVGANVNGVNVGLVGEIGIKFELGLKIGKKTRAYLGPLTIGLNVDEALGY